MEIGGAAAGLEPVEEERATVKHKLADIARRIGAVVTEGASSTSTSRLDLRHIEELEIDGLATLENATPGRLTFLSNRRYKPLLCATRASAVIIAPEDVADCPVAALVMENPYIGYARAAAMFLVSDSFSPGIHPRAIVHEGAQVDPNAMVAAGAVIENGARVAAGVRIGAGCIVGEHVAIDVDTKLAANVVLCRGVQIGRRCMLHPGVVVGADGFGIALHEGRWAKIPQLGSVRIADDVEIGANTTIDRGALDDTVIEQGVKLDNLIQIGHNVKVGAHTAIAACVAIGGSARIGKRCVIQGAASIAGHLEIADDVHLTATSAVANSIHEAGVFSSGMPVQDNRSWRKNVIRMRQLDEMARTLRSLVKRVGAIERLKS